MKALSIRQPWAWLMIRPDIIDAEERVRLYETQEIKDIENRMWRSNNPGLEYRGEFLIHTGLHLDGEFTSHGLPDIAKSIPDKDSLQRGGIVGIAEIIDVVKENPSPWFFGRYGFVIRNARPVEFRPCVGRLGFFTPDYSLKYAEKPPKKERIIKPKPIEVPTISLFGDRNGSL
jgi:hypothetical protein